MGNIYGKGPKGESTRLHSKIVRKVGHCENCGSIESLQAAHIVSRKYNATRTLFNNAFCLCAKCHRNFTDHPVEFGDFVRMSELSDRHDTLYKLAYTYKKMFWKDRLEELRNDDKSNLDLKTLREIEWQRISEDMSGV